MASDERAVCPDNDALVEHMRNWWNEFAQKSTPKTYTENLQRNINKAFTSLCRHKTPITTLKQFSEIKGVGKWTSSKMRDFFKTDSGVAESDNLPKKGKKTQAPRPYLPQKKSVAYALLITLFRGETDGIKSMRKQELIDAAEASGLARVPIAPEKGRGKPGHSGSSKKEWYSGWSAMGKLIDKDLVHKSSNPAKYKLSDEGRKVAKECLSRSGMLDSVQNLVCSEECPNLEIQNVDYAGLISSDSPEELTLISVNANTKKALVSEKKDVQDLELISSYSPEALRLTSVDVNPKKGLRDDIPATFLDRIRLREAEVYGSRSEPRATVGSNCGDPSTSYRFVEGQPKINCSPTAVRVSANAEICAASLISNNHVVETIVPGYQTSQDVLRMPPLGFMEKFEDAYEVIFVLDDREHFTRLKNTNIIKRISGEFNIKIEIERLPVGDGIWIARHKQLDTRYVLDFIVERKNVDDLRSSIRDNRYRDQKLRLLRTGIKKIIYMVEGDANVCEAADSIKTACFTTEILEGFDVQRTAGLSDTLRRYGFLTLAITDYYKSNSSRSECQPVRNCLQYREFKRKCEDVDKVTVSDVFAMQLMQVSQVTEEVAVAVLDCYPTLYSLASAYALLDGDTRAQEELLLKQSKGGVSAVASRNIFHFVWGN